MNLLLSLQIIRCSQVTRKNTRKVGIRDINALEIADVAEFGVFSALHGDSADLLYWRKHPDYETIKLKRKTTLPSSWYLQWKIIGLSHETNMYMTYTV